MSPGSEQAGGTAMTPQDAMRLMELEQRVVELDARVANLVDKLMRLTQVVRGLGEELHRRTGQPEAPTEPTPPASPGMAHVIQLVFQGASEEAQRELYSLPEEELTAQPAVVALVAAALFVQRGDYEHGLQALQRARELTNDPRIMHVIQLVGAQME
jgi:hypothetical protein